MKLNIQNTGLQDLTIGGTLALGVSDDIDIDDGDSVLILGDKPGVKSQFEEAGSVLRDTAEGVRNRDPDAIRSAGSGAPQQVAVILRNEGTNAVRAILGDGVTDRTVLPSTTADLSAPGYIELRELGLVNPNLERQPSSAA